MANTTLRQAFSDIANAIRAKGVTGTMTPLEMPTKIEEISSGDNPLKVPFYVEAVEAGSTVKLTKVGSAPTCTFVTSTDGETWTDWNFASDTKTLTNIGDRLYVKAKTANAALGNMSGNNRYHNFVFTGKVDIGGNIMSLLWNSDFDSNGFASGSSGNFYALFDSCTSLRSSKNLLLPATILTLSCYNSMFYGCSNHV